MHEILMHVQKFLIEASQHPVSIADDTVEEFGERCKEIMLKHFREPKEPFRLRMSNVGRPLCQLQHEKAGHVTSEAPDYKSKMIAIYGDITEAIAMFILKNSGVQIQSAQRSVKLDIGGIKLGGTLDVEIRDAIYDIKSVSQWSFENKFGPNCSFKDVMDSDHFGYTAQGFLYSQADAKPFGGWIVLNKSTGEWNVMETPITAGYTQVEVLNEIDRKIRILTSDEPLMRQFDAEEEVFRKKKTGRRKLNFPCTMCDHMVKCWGRIIYAPQLESEAVNPKWFHYLESEDKETNEALRIQSNRLENRSG